MTDIFLTGNIISMFQTTNAVNVLIVDRDNPKNTVFKVALWESDGEAVMNNLSKGDEITITGKVFGIDTNKYGGFIDLRKCKLISMAKLERTIIQAPSLSQAEENESLQRVSSYEKNSGRKSFHEQQEKARKV